MGVVVVPCYSHDFILEAVSVEQCEIYTYIYISTAPAVKHFSISLSNICVLGSIDSRVPLSRISFHIQFNHTVLIYIAADTFLGFFLRFA